MTLPPHMRGLIELDGSTNDLAALRLVAPACNCAIEPGPDQRLSWLCGTTIERAATPEDAKRETEKLLVVLNGLARMERPQHRNVVVGNVFCKAGQSHFFGPHRPFNPSGIFASSLFGPIPRPPDDPVKERRRAQLVADAKLIDIVKVFGDEVNWQKLRVAFEKIRHLVGNGTDNSLVQHGYTTRQELTRFKANIEDPRLSGDDAVHGVPQGELKGERMKVEDALNFVIQLLDRYLAKSGR